MQIAASLNTLYTYLREEGRLKEDPAKIGGLQEQPESHLQLCQESKAGDLVVPGAFLEYPIIIMPDTQVFKDLDRGAYQDNAYMEKNRAVTHYET